MRVMRLPLQLLLLWIALVRGHQPATTNRFLDAHAYASKPAAHLGHALEYEGLEASQAARVQAGMQSRAEVAALAGGEPGCCSPWMELCVRQQRLEGDVEATDLTAGQLLERQAEELAWDVLFNVHVHAAQHDATLNISAHSCGPVNSSNGTVDDAPSGCELVAEHIDHIDHVGVQHGGSLCDLPAEGVLSEAAWLLVVQPGLPAHLNSREFGVNARVNNGKHVNQKNAWEGWQSLFKTAVMNADRWCGSPFAPWVIVQQWFLGPIALSMGVSHSFIVNFSVMIIGYYPARTLFFCLDVANALSAWACVTRIIPADKGACKWPLLCTVRPMLWLVLNHLFTSVSHVCLIGWGLCLLVSACKRGICRRLGLTGALTWWEMGAGTASVLAVGGTDRAAWGSKSWQRKDTATAARAAASARKAAQQQVQAAARTKRLAQVQAEEQRHMELQMQQLHSSSTEAAKKLQIPQGQAGEQQHREVQVQLQYKTCTACAPKLPAPQMQAEERHHRELQTQKLHESCTEAAEKVQSSLALADKHCHRELQTQHRRGALQRLPGLPSLEPALLDQVKAGSPLADQHLKSWPEKTSSLPFKPTFQLFQPVMLVLKTAEVAVVLDAGSDMKQAFSYLQHQHSPSAAMALTPSTTCATPPQHKRFSSTTTAPPLQHLPSIPAAPLSAVPGQDVTISLSQASLSECHICMEPMEHTTNRGFMHSGSVHTGVCASCCACIMFKPEPVCPFCMERVQAVFHVF